MLRGKTPAAERWAVSFPLAVVVFGVIGWIVTTWIRFQQSDDRYHS
ncbi:hypothetical protein [Alicyclobacillus kakegawensis]|nr:hypothetical protein [Alicyclobacillus kakegawensis]